MSRDSAELAEASDTDGAGCSSGWENWEKAVLEPPPLPSERASETDAAELLEAELEAALGAWLRDRNTGELAARLTALVTRLVAEGVAKAGGAGKGRGTGGAGA